MSGILLAVTLTALFFTVSGFALTFVYNKKDNRCIMCGLKSQGGCLKTRCSKKVQYQDQIILRDKI